MMKICFDGFTVEWKKSVLDLLELAGANIKEIEYDTYEISTDSEKIKNSIRTFAVNDCFMIEEI